MVSNQKLFSIGNFDFRLQHLLVIGVLALSVSISIMIRSTPASYGLELFEFDPFFNYRATEYILENGPNAYFNWIDEKSWHPFGRNISETSQVTLHLTAASLYPIFNFGSSVYDFTILLPVIFGSLTAIVVFAFVRVLGGTTAGLLAALIFSISVPVFTRGLIGWFKSEPLGIFFGFLGVYLFVSAFQSRERKTSFIKIIFSALFLILGLSAWGGAIFFILPIILFYFSLPFLKNEKNSIIWFIPIFSISLILFSFLFERTFTFIFSYGGIIISLATSFVIIAEIIKKYSNENTKIRNSAIFLVSIVVSGIGLLISGIINLPAYRYLNSVNPFLTSTDPLTDSVAEHGITTLNLSFTFLSIFIIFGLIGIWVLFSRKTIDLKTHNRIFVLIISLLGIYISSSFVRLEIFASIALIILSSIGISILLKKLFQSNTFYGTKIIFCGIIILLFLIPVTLPEEKNWIGWSDFRPTIYNGATYFQITSHDWHHAMDWLQHNTPENSVIASWWDYGYWITTMSDRTTLVDNSTLIDWQIKKMAHAFITTPENSWHILNSSYDEDVSQYIGDERILAFNGQLSENFNKDYFEKNGESCKPIYKSEARKLGIPTQDCNPVVLGMDADYVLIYVAAERIPIPGSDIFFFTLDGGGDESKKHWFMSISNHDVEKFLENDHMTPKPHFFENSTLGKLIPFSIYTYVDPNTNQMLDHYENGLVPIYIKDVKYLNSDYDPYHLVYASPSFYSEVPGALTTILIYKINPDYIS